MALLQQVCRAFDRIAPLSFAERAWDNVGVLVEAPVPRAAASRVFLTIDLTEHVVNEALADPSVGVIVAYHPVLFRSFKRIQLADPKQRIAAKCIQAGVSIYSPHTSLDNVPGGINDWMSASLGAGSIRTLTPITGKDGKPEEYSLPEELVEEKIESTSGSEQPPATPELQYKRMLHTLARLTRETSQVNPGSGRVFTLDNEEGIPLLKLVENVKRLFGLSHVRVATALPHMEGGLNVRTVGVCAGSGASVLGDIEADVLLTGEMSHHEVLAALEKGTSVILCEHTNTERGYLEILRLRLLAFFSGNKDVAPIQEATVVVSKVDRDPLQIV